MVGHRGLGLDDIHDELLISVLSAVASSASSPRDLASIRLVCKRLSAMAVHPAVLARVAVPAMAVKASCWSDQAEKFLRSCAEAGNYEACFTLGMIHYYCLGDRRSGGASLMAKAAMASHPAALYSLAVIQFNGSGGSKKDKDLEAGAALCARAAVLGYIPAMRELGHCLQDGYGVTKDLSEGRRMLLEANAHEISAAMSLHSAIQKAQHLPQSVQCSTCGPHQTYSPHQKEADYYERHGVRYCGRFHRALKALEYNTTTSASSGASAAALLGREAAHVANRFLSDWFNIHPIAQGLNLCSHGLCGRPETRRHEFRRCSACEMVNYCSRGCQALDWKLKHKYICQMEIVWEYQEDNREAEGEIVRDRHYHPNSRIRP